MDPERRMNEHCRRVIMPDYWPMRGKAFGRELVEWYRLNPKATRRSGDHGCERDPVRLSSSKICECGTSLYFGLDPAEYIKWDVMTGPDRGYDLRLPWGNNLRFDIKGTPKHKHLIWSRFVNDLYWEKQFDGLIAVSTDDLPEEKDLDAADMSQCWIEGWITKEEFYDLKQVSDGTNGLDPGTWFYPKHKLYRIDELLPEYMILRSQS